MLKKMTHTDLELQIWVKSYLEVATSSIATTK